MSQATFPPARATTSIHVKVSVDPSNAAAFLADLKKAQSEVITYPENVSWDLYHNPEAPGEFKYIENWNASLEWVMAVSLRWSWSSKMKIHEDMRADEILGCSGE